MTIDVDVVLGVFAQAVAAAKEAAALGPQYRKSTLPSALAICLDTIGTSKPFTPEHIAVSGECTT